jgi:TonB family protein
VFIAQARKTTKTAKTAATSAPKATNPVDEMRAVVRNYPLAGEINLLPGGAVAFSRVDEMPTLNDGTRTEVWLAKHLQYPAVARAQKLEGYCLVQFTIDANGQMTTPWLKRSSGHQLLDDEAMRLVRAMPGWNVGMHNGKAVPVSITLPVYFSLIGGGC